MARIQLPEEQPRWASHVRRNRNGPSQVHDDGFLHREARSAYDRLMDKLFTRNGLSLIQCHSWLSPIVRLFCSPDCSSAIEFVRILRLSLASPAYTDTS